jgi:hypothetical protein
MSASRCAPVVPFRVSQTADRLDKQPKSLRIPVPAAPLPWGSLRRALRTLPVVSHRCSPCAPPRSGSFGLPRLLPGLTLGSVARPERTFKVFRATPPPDPHRCGRIVDLVFCSPSKHSPAALTGSRRPPLVGLDGTAQVALNFPASRPSIDRSLKRLYRGHRTRLLPEPGFRPTLSASGCQSRSPVPPSWFRTTSTVCSAFGSQVCCTLLPILGFTAFQAATPTVETVMPCCHPRTATTPRRTSPLRRGLSRHRAPWPPCRSPSREVVGFEAVSVESAL